MNLSSWVGTAANACFALAVGLVCGGCESSSSGGPGAEDAGSADTGQESSAPLDAFLDVPSAGCTSRDQCGSDEVCTSDSACVAATEVCPSGCDAGMRCSGGGGCIEEGACKIPQDCATGFVCGAETCVPGGECGADEFAIDVVPPNVMLVVDRTGSMADADVPGTGGLTRWQVATQAIASVTTAYDGRVRFGLVLFSECEPGGCSPGRIELPIPSDASTINALMGGTTVCGGNDPETVIGGTLEALVGEPTLQDPARSNVVVLLTDGDDNCGGGGPVAAQHLAGQAVPVATYVVGFSGDVDANELTAIAEAGGTAPYYQANDPGSLNAAFDTIAAHVASCTFKLQSTPPDEQIYVYFNNDPAGVPSDPADGYSYDPSTNTLTFHGEACDALEQGEVTDIDVVFGCPKPTPR